MFNNFCNNTKSYRGLEKSLNEILLPDFHSFLSPYFPNDNSLGLRTRNLLKKTWMNITQPIYYQMMIQ